MDFPKTEYSLEMEEMVKIEELGLTIGAVHFPKLFRLVKDDYKRLLAILKLAGQHSRGLSGKEILEILEKNEPVTIMDEKVEALTFPAVYFAFKGNQERFLQFFEETVGSLWPGERRKALEVLEAHFEKDVV